MNPVRFAICIPLVLLPTASLASTQLEELSAWGLSDKQLQEVECAAAAAQAERAAVQADREAKQAEREAKQAEREAKQAEREARQAEREAQREAEREAAQADREAEEAEAEEEEDEDEGEVAEAQGECEKKCSKAQRSCEGAVKVDVGCSEDVRAKITELVRRSQEMAEQARAAVGHLDIDDLVRRSQEAAEQARAGVQHIDIDDLVRRSQEMAELARVSGDGSVYVLQDGEAQEKVAEYLARIGRAAPEADKVREKLRKAQARQDRSHGAPRELEGRIRALEEKLGMDSEDSDQSLEERVAELERRTMRGGMPPVPPAPPAPMAPAIHPSPPTPPTPLVPMTPKAWRRAAPYEVSVPVAPRSPSPPSQMAESIQDRRREIEVTMRRMREEMERLRTEMARLRGELGHPGEDE